MPVQTLVPKSSVAQLATAVAHANGMASPPPIAPAYTDMATNLNPRPRQDRSTYLAAELPH